MKEDLKLIGELVTSFILCAGVMWVILTIIESY